MNWYFSHSGHVPSECEASFLKKAASMDTYGVDPHVVKVSLKKIDPLKTKESLIFSIILQLVGS